MNSCFWLNVSHPAYIKTCHCVFLEPSYFNKCRLCPCIFRGSVSLFLTGHWGYGNWTYAYSQSLIHYSINLKSCPTKCPKRVVYTVWADYNWLPNVIIQSDFEDIVETLVCLHNKRLLINQSLLTFQRLLLYSWEEVALCWRIYRINLAGPFYSVTRPVLQGVMCLTVKSEGRPFFYSNTKLYAKLSY